MDSDLAPSHAGATPFAAMGWQFADDSAKPLDSQVAIEVPVNIRYGPVPYAVMMATPADLEDFAVGFSLSEGIVDQRSDIRGVGVTRAGGAVTLSIDLAPERLKRHLSRKRSLAGRTSCGVCGIEDAAALPMATHCVPGGSPPIKAQAVASALISLRGNQPLHGLTRSVHGAAWCDRKGQILLAREDVGRHNALDKLIGATLDRRDVSDGFILVTSRASFEMVEKAARLQAHTLVTVSAPTSLAVDRAQLLGLNLVSIARDDGCVVFAGELER